MNLYRYDSIDPQLECPLFTIIPGEIRNKIFDLAISSSDTKRELPSEKIPIFGAGGSREGERIDTDLLRTCKLIHQETQDLPALKCVRIEWYRRETHRTKRIPKHMLGRWMPPPEPFVPPKAKSLSLRLFTHDAWLHDWAWAASRFAVEMPQLTYLSISLLPSLGLLMENPYECPWHNELRRFESLKVFKFELTTSNFQKADLDCLVSRVSGWQISLSRGNAMSVNHGKTRKFRWCGLGYRTFISSFRENLLIVFCTLHTPRIPAIVVVKSID